jgi:predicted site-specific integrase-resolvase
MNDEQPPNGVKRHSQNNTWFKTKDLCQLYGVYPSTVRNWERAGKIKSVKTPSGYRLFDKQSVLASMGPVSPAPPAKQNVIYCRVSSSHQKEDLSRQIHFLQSRYPDHQLVTDVGSGLKNFLKKLFKKKFNQKLQCLNGSMAQWPCCF